MAIIWKENPVVGDIEVRGGVTYKYDAKGRWVAQKSPETDPVYNSEKATLAHLEDIPEPPDLSPYLKKGKYTFEIQADGAQWHGEYLKVYLGYDLYNSQNSTFERITPVTLSVKTGAGTMNLSPIISYPSRETSYLYQGFDFKDAEGFLSRVKDFDKLTLTYNIDTVNWEYLDYDVQGVLGDNIILDEFDTYHSSVMEKTIRACYPDIPNEIFNTAAEGELQPSGIPTYCSDKRANLISRPIGNSTYNTDRASNPNILAICSHYDNVFAERNVIQYNKNTIGVGARPNNTTDPFGTSYGTAMQFFEEANNVRLNELYGDVTYAHIIGWGTISGDRKTITATNSNFSFLNCLQVEIGNNFGVGYGGDFDYNGEIGVIESITDTTITFVTALPELQPAESTANQPETLFFWLPEAKIGTIWNYRKWGDYPTNLIPASQSYFQSPAVAIVVYKFRKIRNLTKVGWGLCEEAAVMTASNSTMQIIDDKKVYTTHWDKFRGYGIVDVDKAVEYIFDNYINNDIVKRQILALTPKINPVLVFEDLDENDLVSKKMILDLLNL
ncbi:hypothetical protein TRIP_D300144 [uncultured Paludibacter sp.]|uniref:Uncharacterized protein n=1 Tax=uncultured Paludibacter sp. TaxID=497635 RepID=A0A653AB61_9BACT|nr:hypothetical protein TRIP_D300144 [uncultured Paludibacter sp.]